MGTIFSIFVKIIGGDNTTLGFISTFGGFVMMFSIIPSGYLVDKLNRRFILRIGLIFYLIGFVFFVLANDIYLIFWAQAFISIGNGMMRPSQESLIADSVESNKREKIYGQIYFIRQIFNGVGPLIAVFVFIFIGDVWTLENLKQVILVGIFFILIGMIFQYQMNDKYSLGKESESLPNNYNNNNINNSHNSISGKWWFLPVFILVLGFIIGTGAGMTVRFFPIFFKEIYNLPPTAVNLIFFFSFIISGFMGLIIHRIAKLVGKIEAIVLVQGFAILMLLGIATIPELWLVIPLFLLRGSFMNSSQPLKDSLLMDMVPKKYRGKFNSLTVFSQQFVWNLSAGVGGILLDSTGFPILYVTTATIYILGTFPFLFVRHLVKKPNKKEVL
jgi:MFS family permease